MDTMSLTYHGSHTHLPLNSTIRLNTLTATSKPSLPTVSSSEDRDSKLVCLPFSDPAFAWYTNAIRVIGTKLNEQRLLRQNIDQVVEILTFFSFLHDPVASFYQPSIYCCSNLQTNIAIECSSSCLPRIHIFSATMALAFHSLLIPCLPRLC